MLRAKKYLYRFVWSLPHRGSKAKNDAGFHFAGIFRLFRCAGASAGNTFSSRVMVDAILKYLYRIVLN